MRFLIIMMVMVGAASLAACDKGGDVHHYITSPDSTHSDCGPVVVHLDGDGPTVWINGYPQNCPATFRVQCGDTLDIYVSKRKCE